jgi:hypothetical protein
MPREKCCPMKLATPEAMIISGFLVISVSLDLFSGFGGEVAPNAVSHAMCGMRSLGFFAWPLFPANWTTYAADTCATFPAEPATSMIAFVLKLSVEMPTLIVLTILIFSILRGSSSETIKASAPREKAETYFQTVKSYVPSLLIFGVPAILFWLIFRSRTPDDFRTALLDKIYEDMFLVSLLVSWVIAFGAFMETTLLPALRWLSPNKGWLR